MSQASAGHYCSGCVTRTPNSGSCPNPACRWVEAREPESQEHLPRHYVLLGRYYMGRVLGQGGFGVTYIARDLRLDRAVAIKEFLPADQCARSLDRTTVRSLSGDKSLQFRYGLERFLSEARNVARLDRHPNIVAITDHLEANGTAYMVMEFIEGITLKQYLANQGGRIPPEVAKNILLHAMAGLRKVHEINLLHRDISPDNIMISTQGPVKLIDFGAARLLLGEASQSLSIILKHGYAPEEQYRSKGNQGPWTDVYATAATFYRCVTGVIPPPALDRLTGGVVLERPAKFCPQIPPALEAAILNGLAVRSGNRFQSIAEFQAAILAQAIPAKMDRAPIAVKPPQQQPIVAPLRPIANQQPDLQASPAHLRPAYPAPMYPAPVYPVQPAPAAHPTGLQLLLPPSLHWSVLMVIGAFSGGIFFMVWIFVQANFVRRIDPASQARRLFGLYAVFSLLALTILMVGCIGVVAQTGSTAKSALDSLQSLYPVPMLISVFGSIFFYLGVFNMRQSLLDFYNRVEPLGLNLSGPMTFFFNILYIQHHLSRIATYKKTGFLSA